MKRAITGALLRRAPLFADLPAPLLDEVAAGSKAIFRPKCTRIFEEGSTADCCYLLVEGRLKVVLAGDSDSQITLNVLSPPTLVGEIALLDKGTRSAGIVALDDCHLVQIGRAAFLNLRKNQAFEDKLVVHVAATLRHATEQLRAIYTFDSMERVAWCIARLAASLDREGNEVVMSPRPAHHELADMTGCTRETVTRALLRLRRMGWIRWDANSLRLQSQSFKRYLAPSSE
jgi:CRP-like cAMP-binding protein